MGPSTDRVTSSCGPCIAAACSIIRWQSKGQSCINPRIRTFLQIVLSLAADLHGIAMNFSAEKARRKWPCGGLACGERPMVAVAAMLLVLCAQAEPAAAARRPGTWSQGPWSGLFVGVRPKARRAALPAPVPLPRPRPADAPATEPEKPAAGNKAPAETDKPAEQAAPAPPPPSACRLALTEQIAIAPSIPDIHGPGGCGGEDLVRLGAAGAAAKRRRPRQVRRVRMPRPEPHGRRPTVRTRPRQRARRARAETCQRPVHLAYRPHGRAGLARKRAAFGVRAVFDRAGAGLRGVSRGPHPSRSDGTAQQLQNLSVECVGPAAADRAAAAGRAAG